MKYNQYLEDRLNLKYQRITDDSDNSDNLSESPKEEEVEINEPAKPSESSDMTVEDILLQIALDGIVFNETKAEGSSKCKCAKTTKGTLYCFKSGIIGALSQPQIEEYCPSTEQSFEFSNVNEKTLDEINKISQECNISDTETLPERLKCVYRKAEQENLIK